MKAFVLNKYGMPSDLKLKEIPIPKPTPNEVLVKIMATAANDWDWCIVRGKPLYMRALGLRKPRIKIIGTEISGIIEEIGSEVTKFRVGDRVFGDLSESGFGGFAEFVCQPETALTNMPDNLDFVTATSISHAGNLALQALRDVGKIKENEVVLVNGAGGGVGAFVPAMARQMGASKIIGVDHGDKAESMLGMEYDEVLDYTKSDSTKLGPFDLIIDNKTNRPLRHYRRALNPKGRYVSVGGNMGSLLRLFLLGYLANRWSDKKLKILPLVTNKDNAWLAEQTAAGQFSLIIDGPFAFNDLPQALQRFGDAKHKGKVVIQVTNP